VRDCWPTSTAKPNQPLAGVRPLAWGSWHLSQRSFWASPSPA